MCTVPSHPDAAVGISAAALSVCGGWGVGGEGQVSGGLREQGEVMHNRDCVNTSLYQGPEA